MGKKYLDTKKGTLESSILGVWEDAANVQEMSVDEKYTDAQRRAREKARGRGGRIHKHAPSRTTGHDAGTGAAPGGKSRSGLKARDDKVRALQHAGSRGDKKLSLIHI